MVYPRSFLGLCLASFVLVATPLVGALAYSAWHTERLAEHVRTAVFNASQAARASRTLVTRIGSLERLAMLDHPGLAADLGRVHASFRQVADELLQLPLEQDQLAALKRTMVQEERLYAVLVTPKRASRRAVAPLAAELAENASEVLAISTRVADREVQRLRADAEAVQRQLVFLVLCSTALALAIALGLTRHVVRPIAELDAAIRQLGSADFSQPIAVRGPDDLKTLGERLDWLRRRLAELEAE